VQFKVPAFSIVMGVEVERFRVDGLLSRRCACEPSAHKRTRESTNRSTTPVTETPLLLLTMIVTLDDALGEVYDYIICGEHLRYLADLNLNGVEQVEG
jgi:hypothetical protein